MQKHHWVELRQARTVGKHFEELSSNGPYCISKARQDLEVWVELVKELQFLLIYWVCACAYP